MIAGLVAIGGWLIGGTFLATITLGALVGAAIGGLTAAVMGGDIGKGMLYGAIGGAVTAGVGSMLGGGGSGAATAGTEVARGGAMVPGTMHTAGYAELWNAGAGSGAAVPSAGAGVAAPSVTSWQTKLANSFTSEEAVGKMAGGLLQGVGGAMGSIGAADTAAEAIGKQSEDMLALQRMKGEQSLEQIGATGRETLARTREEIEGRHAEARIPFEERRIREENIAKNLGMLTTGAQV